MRSATSPDLRCTDDVVTHNRNKIRRSRLRRAPIAARRHEARKPHMVLSVCQAGDGVPDPS
ncbi:hypothetical protein BEL01nite_69340 [Bradyrhizobium elkanii]|nr:hypothetical protein BEL01nite_69340 [Bradyrhizobium elkanii]